MSTSQITAVDHAYMQQAIELANTVEFEGNLPIAALVVIDDKVIAKAGNKILSPEFHPGRHAEIEALNQIPGDYLHKQSRNMTLYTTQEPCIMCVGAIVLYRIGRIVFGGNDPKRGATYLFQHLDNIYAEAGKPNIVGPIMPEVCDPMFLRADKIYRAYRDSNG